MHLHRERIRVPGTPTSLVSDVATVTLNRDDVEAIDLALRVMLAAATPRDAYFLDLTRVRAKLQALDGQAAPLTPRVNRHTANRTVSGKPTQNESS